MKRGCRLVIIIWSLLWIGVVGEVAPRVQAKGLVVTYRLPEGEGLLISRDGGTAYAPAPEQVILEQPGNYYITYYDAADQLQVITVSIPYAKQATYFEIHDTADLHEGLKQILTQQTESATLQFMATTYTFEELVEVVKAASNDVSESYPLLFYTSYDVASAAGTNPTVHLTVHYPTPATTGDDTRTFAMYTQEAEVMLQSLVNTLITPDMTDYEREQAIYSYLAARLTYATTTEGEMIHSLQGTLLNQEGVCDGYARTFMYLMNSVGVPTTFVTGTAGNVGHAWNQVCIQNQFYHVDLTWGDNEIGDLATCYDYMNESDDYMARTHQWDRQATQVATSHLYHPLFLANDTPGVYQVKNATHWRTLQTAIKHDASQDYTFIFYEAARNDWDTAALLQTLIATKRCGVRYRVIEKYDTLVIVCTCAH